MNCGKALFFISAACILVGLPACELGPENPDSTAASTEQNPGSHSSGLHYAVETPASQAAVAEALNTYYAPPDFDLQHWPWMANRSKLEIQPPIAHYDLSAADALDERGLAGAKLDTYSYFVKVAGKIVDQIDLLANNDGSFSKNAGYLRGLGPARLAKSPYLSALTQAASLEAVRRGSFEVRLLDLPPFKSSLSGYPTQNIVLWLKSENPHGDLIYTFPADAYREIQPGLQASTLYTAEDALKAIRPSVRQLSDLQAATPTPPTHFVEPKPGPAGESAKGLHYAADAHGSKDAAVATLNNYYSSANDGTPLRQADRSKLEIQPPVAHYSLSADNVLHDRGLETAKLLEYTYGIKLSGQTLGEITLTPLPNGMFRNAGIVKSTYEADEQATLEYWLAQAENLEQVRKGSFEARLLDLPPYDRAPIGMPVSGVVLWLKSDIPGGDLIYTLPAHRYVAPPEPGLQPSTLYSAAEMLKAIQPAVKTFQDGQAGRAN